MIELLKQRRSIRKYKKDKIEPEKVEQLIKAALLSPSSRGLKPWEFIVVDDPDILKKLAASKEHGSSFLENAALAIVVLADPMKCDVWIEDTSIASIILHLTAQSLELGSCWIQIRERFHDNYKTSEDYIRNLLDIPNNYKVESIISFGYAAEHKRPYDEKDLNYSKVHRNKFGFKWR